MPTTIRCHECDHRLLAPDEAAGKTIRCPRCKAVLKVPLTPKLPDPPAPDPQPAPAAPRLSVDSEPAQPHWEAAPPPVRRPTPAPPAAEPPEPESTPDAYHPESEDSPQTPAYERDALPEPWYYSFLEKYTLTAMFIGIIGCVLAFILSLVSYTLLLASPINQGGPQDDLGKFLAVAIFSLLLNGLVALGIVFAASLILLAVDAARNLRAVRFQTRGP